MGLGEGGDAEAGGLLGDVAGVGGVAGDDAEDIAVDADVGEAEGDARDGAGGVVADAGEGADFVVSGGEAAEGEHLLGGALEVAGAGVIAEAGPGGEEVGFGGGGEGGEVGEAGKEAFVIGNDSSDAGLLEHDFREPDAVGVAGVAPREVALVGEKPLVQRGGKSHVVGIIRKSQKKK